MLGDYSPPRSPNIIWPSLSSILIHYGHQWPEMLTRPKTSNIHTLLQLIQLIFQCKKLNVCSMTELLVGIYGLLVLLTWPPAISILGRFKNAVYKTNPRTLEELKRNTREEINIVSRFFLLRWETLIPQSLKKSVTRSPCTLLVSIVECALSVLNGNCKLSDCSKRKLAKFKTVLRALCKKTSIRKKRKLIVQNGGFFIPLLSAVLPTLVSLIAKNVA